MFLAFSKSVTGSFRVWLLTNMLLEAWGVGYSHIIYNHCYSQKAILSLGINMAVCGNSSEHLLTLLLMRTGPLEWGKL